MFYPEFYRGSIPSKVCPRDIPLKTGVRTLTRHTWNQDTINPSNLYVFFMCKVQAISINFLKLKKYSKMLMLLYPTIISVFADNLYIS